MAVAGCQSLPAAVADDEAAGVARVNGGVGGGRGLAWSWGPASIAAAPQASGRCVVSVWRSCLVPPWPASLPAPLCCSPPAAVAAAPPPPPSARAASSGAVFYDENGNGQPTAGRRPGARRGGARSARSDARSAGRTGSSAMRRGPRGASTRVTVRASTLPPYYTRRGGRSGHRAPAGRPRRDGPVSRCPSGQQPAQHLHGLRRQHHRGEGSSDDAGYRAAADAAAPHFGARPGDQPGRPAPGARGRSASATASYRARPAYTLILYGTNDWNDAEPSARTRLLLHDREPAEHRSCRRAGRRSLPVLATIIPATPRPLPAAAAQRVGGRMNELIRPWPARKAARWPTPRGVPRARANPDRLFVDHVHPNDRGYEIIADGSSPPSRRR